MEDKVYYYDETNKYFVEFGEIQKGFNDSFVIDGTKDSTKIIVWSYYEKKINPFTLVWHKNTNTFWSLSKDNVSRELNENGFVYIHTLQLNGAIDILNARDLTDCGFTDKRYTIKQFIERFFSLAPYTFPVRSDEVNIDFGTDNKNLNPDSIVDYMKSFENYTLLSALREFLDGYNCLAKLDFTTYEQNGTFKIDDIKLKIIPKTGLLDEEVRTLDYFNETKANSSIGKDSYGTTVVSNAENVISTLTKTFPTVGSVKPTGVEAFVTPDNAIIRLPSNAYYVNWLKMFYTINLEIHIEATGGDYQSANLTIPYVNGNEKYNNDVFNTILNQWVSNSGTVSERLRRLEIYNDLMAQKDNFFKIEKLASSLTIYNCNRWNPYDKNWVAPTDNPDFYFVNWHKASISNSPYSYDKPLVLCPKEVQESLPEEEKTYFSFVWERGKNTISNLKCISPVNPTTDVAYFTSYASTDLRDSTYDNEHVFYEKRFVLQQAPLIEDVVQVNLSQPDMYNSARVNNVSFVVNYVPMNNLKIKYDNSGVGHDIQLYNQNGKLTDSNALSKLILSYSKEIESENITRYKNFVSFSDVPKVGSLFTREVDGQTITYVLNSVSLDFTQNENGYYIEGEFTLSQNIAVKSLLTNPNSNIRDYGIPQNNNVVRKQLYRDFYELTHEQESTSIFTYMPLNKVLNVSNYPTQYNEHIAVIKLLYKSAYGGDPENDIPSQNTWYYQLDTTTYMLKKSIYEVVDFKDNNIIGYGVLNVSSAFDVRKLLTGLGEMANTPISYVDDNGEFGAIQIAMCNADQLQGIYEHYIEVNGVSTSLSLYNSGAFIDEEIFNGKDASSVEPVIESSNYFEFAIHNPDSELIKSIDITEQLEDVSFTGQIYQLRIQKVEMTIDGDEVPLRLWGAYITFDGDKYYINFTLDYENYSGSLDGDVYVYVNVYWDKDSFKGAIEENDFVIEEEAYKKDAIEVPVFEYSCQVDDSKDVVIGENIFDSSTDTEAYFYTYVLLDKNIYNENNAFNQRGKVEVGEEDGVILWASAEHCASMECKENTLEIEFYDYMEYEDMENMLYGSKETITNLFKTKDIAIFRHKLKTHMDTYYDEDDEKTYAFTEDDLMFIIRNTNDMEVNNDKIILKINHYKIS